MAESRVGVFAIYNVEPIHSSPSTVGPNRREGAGGHQRGRVENALTASERANERASLVETQALAVSRDNWDTVYYRLRAIYAVRGV